MSHQDAGLVWESLTPIEQGFICTHNDLKFDFSQAGGRGLLVCVDEFDYAWTSSANCIYSGMPEEIIVEKKYTVAEYLAKPEPPSQ